jgi:hypothetical protein
MGVQFDRFLEDFSGPFEAIPYGEFQNPKGKMNAYASGYVLNAKSNLAFTAVNDLINSGVTVYRLPNGSKGIPAGSFYVASSAKAKTVLQKAVNEAGLDVTSLSKAPSMMSKVSSSRIALWDTYGGSMPSGWIRWLFEQYHFKADVIYVKDIDDGNLRKKYDVVILVGGAVPAVGRSEGEQRGFTRRDPKPEEIPSEYHSTLGKITPEKSIPQLKKFMEEGGNIVTIGSSANLAYHLKLPVKNALTEIGPNGQERNIPSDKYYIPGSLLQVNFDSTQQATWGMGSKADVYFSNSPVFNLAPDALAQGRIKPLAWFTDEPPLRSGWAWGQVYLKNGVTAFEAQVGKGKLITFGPEITFRGQSQGTFKLLFNELIQTAEVPKLNSAR